MSTLAEWADIKYKAFSTGLSRSRRFSTPQNATEDYEVIEAIKLYQDSKSKLIALGMDSRYPCARFQYDKAIQSYCT